MVRTPGQPTRRDAARLLGAGLAGSLSAAPLSALARSGAAIDAITVAAGLPDWMDTVARDLAADCERAYGTKPGIRRSGAADGALVLVGPEDFDSLPGPWAERAATLAGGSEAFAISSLPADARGSARVAILGASAAGVRRGVYHFSRTVLQLDPTWHWTGLTAPSRPPLDLSGLDLAETEPPFRHRGWFINDEDLLTGWMPPSGRRIIDYPFYHTVVNLDAIDRVCETAARLGMNMIIPASLLNIFNPAEERLLQVAARRGLLVTQHHIEPVGVSGFTYDSYWKARGQSPRFSFYSERERMIEIWRDSIRRWSKYDTVWALGLRGVGDRPLWLSDPTIPRDDKVVGKLISNAIAVQREMVLAETGGTTPRFTAVLWAEGATLMAGGHLTIPKDVTLVFADNSPGLRMQADFHKPREPGRRYGIYYHQQLWASGPHLVQAVAPASTTKVVASALATGANDYVLINASNVREFVAGLTLTGHMVEHGLRRDPDAALERLCRRWYGREGAAAGRIYRAFFAAYVREPEHGRQLFLDGLLRDMGRDMIALLRRSWNEPETLKRDESWQWFIRSLPDMAWIDPRPPQAAAMLRTQRNSFAAVAAKARKLAARLPAPAAAHLTANILAQSEILLGLIDWVLALVDAVAAHKRNQTGERDAARTRAIEAISRAENGKALARGGQWQNWYSGETKMNVPELVRQTVELSAGR